VKLSEPVKSRLEDYRDKMGHSSLDSAVREVMMKADVNIGEEYMVENDDGNESGGSSVLDDVESWGVEE